MNKIIIFGANGGVGKYLVDYFLSSNKDAYEIIGVGRRPEPSFLGKIKYLQLDITKKEDFKQLPLDDVSTIIDLAGAMPAKMEGYNPKIYIESNVLGTYNVLEYCRLCHAERIIYTQSFGDIKMRAEKELVLKPDMTPLFDYNTDHSVYVVTKNAAVDLIKCYQAQFGIKAFIFRLPNIYSWGQSDTFYLDGKIKRKAWRVIIDKACAGENIEVWGDPNRVKDMVYVKDLCQMIYKASFASCNGGHYNVGTGIGVSLIDQVKGIIEVFGNKNQQSKIVFCPNKPNAPQYIMWIDNAKEDLGYNPQYLYLDMLRDMKQEKEYTERNKK